MNKSLGKALQGFSDTLEALSARLERFPSVDGALFSDVAEWRRLLHYKLLPHLAGEGCLVVAVAGGTNTGKSTVFNLLLGRDISPVRATAAATCRPVVAANDFRREQCLSGALMPEFLPAPLEEPQLLVSGAAPEHALFVASAPGLPDRLVLLDIPDVDSIDKQNWEVAENIQAAGDVLIAVLTGEKYKDERVITFFRRAAAAGRRVFPLMNKANPANDYEVARLQLADFMREVGLDDPACFALPHDFALEHDFSRPIAGLDQSRPLGAYLESLEVADIKTGVYRDSVRHFVAQTEDFLLRADGLRAELARVVDDLREQVAAVSGRYDPQPDAHVGKILHQYIQERRGFFSRTLGSFGAMMGRNVLPLGAWLKRALASRMLLDETPPEEAAEQQQQRQQEDVVAHTRDLLRQWCQQLPNLPEPTRSLIAPILASLHLEETVNRVSERLLGGETVSEAFCAHARGTIDAWWQDHASGRRFLQMLDTLLIMSPTAIAAPLAYFTGGIGVPEIIALTGPLAGDFVSRVMEYQLADKWFDLLSPWREEQQARFQTALLEEALAPLLTEVNAALEALDAESLEQLWRHREQCQRAC